MFKKKKIIPHFAPANLLISNNAAIQIPIGIYSNGSFKRTFLFFWRKAPKQNISFVHSVAKNQTTPLTVPVLMQEHISCFHHKVN